MKKLVGLVVLLMMSNSVFSQNTWTTLYGLGKNRIQYKDLRWRTIKSNHFEINFYQGGDKIARNAAQHLETEYSRITSLMSYTPFDNMKIYIYATTPDLQQSNMGLSSPIALDGGMLNLAKSRIEIAHDGNDATFKKELTFQTTRLFVYDMLYGGNLKEALQSTLLLTVPDWFIEGMATYASEDWDGTKTLAVQQALNNNKLKRLSALKDKDAKIIGHSIWHYIAQRYSKDNIGNILNLTRIIRNEQSSVASSVGVPFNKFLKDWRAYYMSGAVPIETVIPSTIKKSEIVPTISAEKASTLKDLQKGEIDTDNYEFSIESLQKVTVELAQKEKTKRERSINKAPTKEAIKISSPSEYENRLIITESENSIMVDPLRGMGLKPEVSLTDLLENHVFKVGAYIPSSFRSVDYFGEYHYLANRIDYGLKVNRNILNEEYFKNQVHEAMLIATYPFGRNSNFSFGTSYFSSRRINTDQLSEPDKQSSNLGLNAEYVFDNTQGANNRVDKGIRAKLNYRNYIGLSSKQASFNRFLLDARYYKPILNKFTFAARFSASHSAGKNLPKIYMGGVENLLSNKEQRFEKEVSEEQFRDIYLAGFVTPLRGFGLNKISGSSHLLTNLELRLPLNKVVENNENTKGFLQQFEIVGFSDIGTAWNGKNPFSRQNSLNTEIVGGGSNPFQATVTNFRNPFFMSYGVGVRTILLGYAVRADYAWTVEDKIMNSPVLQLSLGYDF